ncbi:unnamed protein product [Echinostoma caproni]|uniref:WD_REPEATS_REGION domain-containing protein n=1 Tax=Echinostoma caproni TaxID=27848 RepID=A0A183B8I9_9TREM|nr:unnamed protein product [Echinostoma caproni]
MTERFYVWDICDLNNIRRCMSHFYHSRGVWSIDCFSDSMSNLSPSASATRFSDSGSCVNNAMPSWWTSGTFATCADDGTIRFWSLGDDSPVDSGELSVKSLQDLSQWGVPSDSNVATELSYEATPIALRVQSVGGIHAWVRIPPGILNFFTIAIQNELLGKEILHKVIQMC